MHWWGLPAAWGRRGGQPYGQQGMKSSCYLFRVGGMAVGPTGAGSLARFANHSCGPNCRAQIDDKKTYVAPKRTAKKSGELTIDYMPPCSCGAKACGGYLDEGLT